MWRLTVASKPASLFAFERMSLTAGELEPGTYRSSLDSCPFWQRPFLRSGDRYTLPVAGHALRSPLDAFEQRLLSSSNSFSQHLAKVVDELALGYLTEALPGCEAFGPGAYYHFDDGDGSQRYETDGLIVFEGWVLIIEGKASALSHQAHREDLKRLGRDIAGSLNDAWNQCARVQRYMTSVSTAKFETERADRSISVEGVVPNRPVRQPNAAYARVLCIRVAAPGIAREVSVTGRAVAGPHHRPTRIAELSGPAGLLHYLQWRSLLPLGDGMQVADELDIFGTYLFGGVGGPSPTDEVVVSMASSTTSFDDYYLAIEAGQCPTPPRRVLGEWLESVLNDLADSRTRRWLDQSFIILDLTLTDAAWLSSFALTLAPWNIASRRWYADQFGDIVAVAVAEGLEWTEVLLEVSPVISQGRRWFAIRLDADGPQFLSCVRNR